MESPSDRDPIRMRLLSPVVSVHLLEPPPAQLCGTARMGKLVGYDSNEGFVG
jgi:hypothetical protein